MLGVAIIIAYFVFGIAFWVWAVKTAAPYPED